MSDSAPLLEVSGLSVHLLAESGIVRAVDGVDLSVQPGEAVGLVGESGSGKSMTALTLMGLLPVNARIVAGSVRFQGRELVSLSEREWAAVRGSGMAMTFQDPATYLNPVLKVGDQVGEAVRAKDPGADLRARVPELLDMVRLPRTRDVAGLYPHELSGGMRQRVLLAIALAGRPRLLVADEPTTALDVTIQAQVLDLVGRLVQELGLSLILISHDFGVIARVCDRVCVMYAGRVVEDAPIGDIYAAPNHPYTQGLLAATLSVHHRRPTLAAMPGSVPDMTAPPSGCHFHPRCGQALERCSADDPPAFRRLGGQGRVQCWLRDPAREPLGPLEHAGPAEAASMDSSSMPGEPARTPLLRVRHLAKSFRRHSGVLFGKAEAAVAVDDVNLDVFEGETLALVGESGSGKSTLARIVLGLLKADRGSVVFDGAVIEGAGRALPLSLRRQLQMVFQDPLTSLNPRKTVYATLAQPLKLHGIAGKRSLAKRVAELLATVGLTPPGLYAGRYPHELSGGQRQRVALARALAPAPRLLVADEPVASLDVSVRAQVLNLMREARLASDVSYLFITHDLGVVRAIADRVAVMYLGRIVELGATEDVLRAPGHPYTQALLAATPEPDPALARRASASAISGEIPSSSRLPSGCRFHPRCPAAMPLCASVEPEMMAVGPGWAAACHLLSQTPPSPDPAPTEPPPAGRA